MSSKRIFIAALSFFAAATAVRAQGNTSINGLYLTQGENSKVEVYSSGDFNQGIAVWNKKHGDVAEYRIRVLQNLQYDPSTNSWAGRVYDPYNNRSYMASVERLDNGNLKITARSGPFSKSFIWTRVSGR